LTLDTRHRTLNGMETTHPEPANVNPATVRALLGLAGRVDRSAVRPFVTRLASLSTLTVESHDCDGTRYATATPRTISRGVVAVRCTCGAPVTAW